MNLEATYMGLNLKNPLIVASSEITSRVDTVKLCASKGAAAIVLKSLFEEQIMDEIENKLRPDDHYFWFPEAAELVKTISKEHGVTKYIKLIEECKKSVSIPIIASINCISASEWTGFSEKIESAGADALELNISIPVFNTNLPSAAIEQVYYDIVDEVTSKVKIPVAVKIAPFFSNLPEFILNIKKSGAKAVVLFNRHYRPDIDIDKMALTGNHLSSPDDLTLSLRWVSLLSGRLGCDIAASGGIHGYEGVVKQILCGAKAVQLCSTLYKNTIGHMAQMLEDLEKWMGKNGYDNLDNFRGKMVSDRNNYAQFERIQYIRKSTSGLL